jgi:OCT family organic cation transporter-like MFS transporter 1
MESLPLLLFGIMSMFSGLLALYFPETLNVKLPDTVEEAENIGKLIRRVNDDSKNEEEDTGKSKRRVNDDSKNEAQEHI